MAVQCKNRSQDHKSHRVFGKERWNENELDASNINKILTQLKIGAGQEYKVLICSRKTMGSVGAGLHKWRSNIFFEKSDVLESYPNHRLRKFHPSMALFRAINKKCVKQKTMSLAVGRNHLHDFNLKTISERLTTQLGMFNQHDGAHTLDKSRRRDTLFSHSFLCYKCITVTVYSLP